MMKETVVLGVLFFVLSISSSYAIIYVDSEAPGGGTGTYENPYNKIQDAIDAAYEHDIIIVRPGIYTGVGNYEINPTGKSITIQSTDPNDIEVIESTIIDPNQAGPGFYFESGENENCIIQGLTITNAHRGGSGGGIYCYNSQPTIRKCIIENCTSNTHGGGLFFLDSVIRLSDCIIRNNSAAADGGGIESFRSEGSVTNCLFYANNNSTWRGGGIDIYGSESFIITNCTFTANSADWGEAVMYGIVT